MTTHASDLVTTLLTDTRDIPSVTSTRQFGTMAERIHRSAKYRFSLRKVLDTGLMAALADRSVDRYCSGRLKLPNDVVFFEAQENWKRHCYVAWQTTAPADGRLRIFLRYYVRTLSPSLPPGDFYTVPATGVLPCRPEQSTGVHWGTGIGMQLSDFAVLEPDLHLGRVSSELGSELSDGLGTTFDEMAAMLALLDLETTLKQRKPSSRRADQCPSNAGAPQAYAYTMITTPDIRRTIGEVKGWLDVLDLEAALERKAEG